MLQVPQPFCSQLAEEAKNSASFDNSSILLPLKRYAWERFPVSRDCLKIFKLAVFLLFFFRKSILSNNIIVLKTYYNNPFNFRTLSVLFLTTANTLSIFRQPSTITNLSLFLPASCMYPSCILLLKSISSFSILSFFFFPFFIRFSHSDQ